MRSLYPAIDPYREGTLQVDDLHTLYFEESGNPQGTPALFLHGGPGSGTDPSQRRFFDPEKYRIILVDQRGCGKSTPHAELQRNTTWDLISDIEKLRSLLHIERWVVFGGSWGSTLSLAYAIKHPQSVRGLILRGIFLGRKQDIHWFYQDGAHRLFPDSWERFLAPISQEERGNLVAAYYKRLTSSDPNVRKVAAHAWSAWEAETVKLKFDSDFFKHFTAPQRALSIACIECHYFLNHTFFPTDNWILENIDAIRAIPTVIVHGRYDIVCPFENAWDLHKKWPEADLKIIADAGHAATEPGTLDALLSATDAFASLQ